VTHQPSANTEQLAAAVVSGAQDPSIDSVTINARLASEADAADVLRADAIIIGTTENFGNMAGLTKDFFERVYYPCLDHTQGTPYALYVRAGQDGTGTVEAVQRITVGLRWRAVQSPLLLAGVYQTDFAGQCQELGMAMAAGLMAGIFLAR